MKYILKIFFENVIHKIIKVKWFIEENLKILRKEKIVKPLIDATILLKKQIIRIIFFCSIQNIIVIGIIFWIVNKIKQFIHEILSIKEITQNWNGNTPIFIKIPKKIVEITNWLIILIFDNVNQIIDLKIIIEETLWIRK